MPTVLELLSYVFFCGASIVGPFFEFSDYKMYIERTDRYANIPSTFKAAVTKFLKGKACLALNLVIGTKFWPLFCGTEEFTEYSFLYKVVYYYIAITSMRLFYYSGWCITDGAIIASGLGYAGKDKNGEEQFNEIYSIRIRDVELGLSPQIMMQHWNHMIHLWLKHYVYNRTLVKGKKPTAMNNIIVFIMSAFWHGFYPFYYVMFFFCALVGEISKDMYRSRIYFRWIPDPLNSILANFIALLVMNYMGASFQMLTFERGYRFSSTLYHFIFILVLVTFAIMRFGRIPQRAAKLEAKLKAKEEAKNTPVANDGETKKSQ